MEPEVEGRVQSLPYKVRSVSRESAVQKAVQVLDPDLRTHWSTSTNAKEWLVLELEESSLLSHIRIHNKSVLEWEISIGLRFKPDTYLKVRPRCEAPRRDVTYHTGYQPCCFVRISCLRGNPIAIFHVQLMGIPVPGLEPELQPVVDHVLPHVIAHIRDPHDIYIQLLQDVASRLSPFLPQLEGELAAGTDGMESSIRFFAMLVGPFYPILKVVGGRENDKAAPAGSESEATKSNQPTVFTVSSNFQAPPKRVRSPGILQQPSGLGLALRPDAALVLLRAACKDNYLGNLCRKVGRLLRKLNGSSSLPGENLPSVGDSPATTGGVMGTGFEEGAGGSDTVSTPAFVSDYSSIFGEDYRILDDDGVEISHAGTLDVAAVEEGLLHILYACAPQPIISRRLADSKSDLIPVLPLVQALLPALRPLPSTTADADHVDETFWQWQTPLTQRGLTQVVALSSSPSYRPLLDACAGYLSSYSLAHEKAACVLIDLCAGPLAPWLPMVVAKIDLAIELLGDLLGIIQAGHGMTTYGRAALVYLMLALSGHVDDVLAQYKDVKHHVLFLIEMLEPFLIPAITPLKSTIAFGDVSAVLDVKQEQSCALALDLLHTAIQKPAVLPTMEAEWKRGHVTPSVLLSILAPHVPQPPGIDARGSSVDRSAGPESVSVEDASGTSRIDSLPNSGVGDSEVISKGDLSADGSSKVDIIEDPNLLFAPIELKNVTLPSVTSQFEGTTPDTQKLVGFTQKGEGKIADDKSSASGSKLVLDPANAEKYFYLQSEYLQLVNSQERALRALEFTRFATELHSRRDSSLESHQAAIDALLLAAECHLNPFFMVPSNEYQEQVARLSTLLELSFPTDNSPPSRKMHSRPKEGLEKGFQLEEERDKAVLSILLEAAGWDSSNAEKNSGEGPMESDENTERANKVQIFKEDSEAEDALTLIREHQELLCTFFVRQLQRERHNMYEVLLQGLLLILDSATKLSAPPVQVIDVILQCAERLNNSIVLYYTQVKDGSMPSESAGVYGIRRQWALLRRLVLVGSGGRSVKEDHDLSIPEGSLLQTALIPAGAWMAKIEEFPRSAFPLVRYVGWMALARYAKYYKEAGLLLVSDVEQLTSLLIIFSDELYSVIGWKQRKIKEDDILMEAAYKVAIEQSVNDNPVAVRDDHVDPGGLVKALYPELDFVFPGLRSQFSEFAESILESVCELLKAIPSSSIPDLLSWFSEICRHPFPASVKGYAVANVKYVILFLLEVIVVEHMEAIVPELPRLIDVVLSLCSSTYSDVPLLESVLAVLKPIISHATAKAASIEEYAQAYNPGMSFESVCFDAMLARLKAGPSATHQQSGDSKSALVLFLAGYLLSDLSVSRRNELIASSLQWANFTGGNSTTTFYHYLRAFQKIMEECGILLERLSSEQSNGSVHDGKPGVQKPATQALFALTAPSGPPLTPRQQITSPGLDSGVDYEESELEHSTVEDEGAAGSVEAQDDPPSSEAVTEHTPEDEQASVDDGTTSLDSEIRVNPLGSVVTIEEFKGRCTELVEALGPSLEACWKIHPQLTSKVAHLAAKCLYYSGFQEHIVSQSITPEGRSERTSEDVVGQQVESGPSVPFPNPIEVLAKKVLKMQEAHCWQVASVIMDYLLSLLSASSPSQALSAICAVLQYQCSHAPRVAWRLQASQWLAKALPLTGTDILNLASDPLIWLLCVMLDHSEPEQRLGALQQLRKLIKDELDWTLEIGRDEVSTSSGSLQESKFQGLAQVLVAATWDKVATIAASDPLLGLRKEAMELLLKFVPFAKPSQLHSFLKSSNTVLPTSTSSGVTVDPGPLTRLALMVLSRSCLYISEGDVSMIPARVWDTIHLMADAKIGGVFAQPERALCQALLKLQEHGEAAKEPLNNIISGNVEKPSADSNFAPVRGAVLEVLARLCAVWSKEDSTRSAADDLAKEVEEAEIELELVSQQRLLAKSGVHAGRDEPVISDTPKVAPGDLHVDLKERLMQLRSQTVAEERNNLKAIIAARREKQRIARRDRHLAMEIAASKEIELLQELDRERAAEAEREIERQRTLEKERAKTREMRHTLEMEAERRSQREYQRELEQRESGAVRSTRRGEFASSTTTPSSSRPRERYRERERESGRTGQEGSSRSSAGGGSGGRESAVTPPATPTAAAGPGGGSSSTAAATAGTGASNRSYNSGFTQAARDRDERGGYEDSGTEGNGVSRGETGDGNNFNDGDGGGSGLDGGSSGNVASSQRQGSTRSSRLPRQIVERRERDSRREGKWERKQT